MSAFEYRAFNEDGKLIRPKALDLILFSNAAQQLVCWNSDIEKGSHPKGTQLDYLKSSIEIINSLTEKKDNTNLSLIISKVTRTLVKQVTMAAKTVEDLGGKLLVASNLDELCYFFKEFVVQHAEIEILSDHYTKDSRLPLGGDHHTKIRFNHDGNEWLYECKNVRELMTGIDGTPNGAAIDTFLSINGIINPTLSEDAKKINVLFILVMVITRQELLIEHGVADYSRNPEFVRQAKMISAIIGGDYGYYLDLVGTMEEKIEQLSFTRSRQQTIEYILSSQLRVCRHYIKDLAVIFKDKIDPIKAKAIYH